QNNACRRRSEWFLLISSCQQSLYNVIVRFYSYNQQTACSPCFDCIDRYIECIQTGSRAIAEHEIESLAAVADGNSARNHVTGGIRTIHRTEIMSRSLVHRLYHSADSVYISQIGTNYNPCGV